MDVQFQRFQLYAGLVGHVPELNGAEVGKSGLGTNRGVLRDVDGNFIALELVGPGFELRQLGSEAAFGVGLGVPAW